MNTVLLVKMLKKKMEGKKLKFYDCKHRLILEIKFLWIHSSL